MESTATSAITGTETSKTMNHALQRILPCSQKKNPRIMSLLMKVMKFRIAL
jgi:hypothetical protein